MGGEGRRIVEAREQALYLMNSPFALETSRHAARRLLALDTDDAGRLQDLYRRSFGRTATATEVEAATRFLAAFQKTAEKSKEPAVDA